MTRPLPNGMGGDLPALRDHLSIVHDTPLPKWADARHAEQIHRADHWHRDVRHEHDGIATLPHIRDLAADPDRACPHEDFTALVEVNRLTDGEDGPVTGYMADLTIACANCAETFRFVGVPAGVMSARPAVSLDEATLHLPIRPSSADPDFGLGIPGYAPTYTERDTRG